MAYCTCPLYVPGPSRVLRIDAETVSFCDAPPLSPPPVGVTLSQFTLLLPLPVDTLVDHIPTLPQFVTQPFGAGGWLLPQLPKNFKAAEGYRCAVVAGFEISSKCTHIDLLLAWCLDLPRTIVQS